VVAGLGPGLFTGTRVTVGTLKAIAYARRLPLLGASSLEAMALGAARGAPLRRGDALALDPDLASGPLCPAIDARKGEVYGAAYEVRRGLPHELVAPLACPATQLADVIRPLGNVAVFGTGTRATKAFETFRVLDGPLTPGAAEIAYLALRRDPQPIFDLARVLAVEPSYLRPPEAEVARRKREEQRQP
jgi:tRNA threonylcarbamoyladenosine biosynthesis protein TsaB